MREVGWFGYTTVVIFVVDLLIALVYAFSVGALSWAPADRRKLAGEKIKVGSPTMNIAEITRFNSIEELVTDPTGQIQPNHQVVLSQKLHLHCHLKRSKSG